MPISHRKLNYLTDDRLDPLSKEPDYNHSAVSIKKIYLITTFFNKETLW